MISAVVDERNPKTWTSDTKSVEGKHHLMQIFDPCMQVALAKQIQPPPSTEHHIYFASEGMQVHVVRMIKHKGCGSIRKLSEEM